MTKREMLKEMMPKSWHERNMENRMRNSKGRIEEVYNYFQKTDKKEIDKAFCMNVLTVW